MITGAFVIFHSPCFAANDAEWFLDLVLKYSDKSFCPPPNTTLGSLAQTLTNYQNAHPEFRGRLTDKQAIQGLAESYPCQTDSTDETPSD